MDRLLGKVAFVAGAAGPMGEAVARGGGCIVDTRVLGRVDPELVARWRHRTLLKRLGEPLDVAPALVFPAGDASAFITGIRLPVSGGLRPAL